MTSVPSRLIPARQGTAAIVLEGETIKIINTHGKQVIDTWALALLSSTQDSDPGAQEFMSAPEYMSVSHTRASLNKVTPSLGDTLVSQKRQPLLKIVEDTSPGIHDTLIAACDPWRYTELGVQEYHHSCTENFWNALHSTEISLDQEAPRNKALLPRLRALVERFEKGGRIPDPLNLFMNIPVSEEGKGANRGLSFEESPAKEGDYVCLKAQRDLVVVMSACPQDVLVINGGEPRDCWYQVLD